MDIKNKDLTGYTITDELYTDFGAVKRKLDGWPAFKADGFAIYTDATPHAGSALIRDTDYTLNDKDIALTDEAGEDVFSKLTMINNTTGNIYISYESVGSYSDADYQMSIKPYTPAAKNIASANGITDLSVYEAGGAQEKPDGWKIKVSWTGGTGTCFHVWTGTAYTINGLAIANFICAGTGYVILEKDSVNSNWILIDDGRELVYAMYTNSSSVGADTIINFDTKVSDNYGAVTTGASWKFTAPRASLYLLTEDIVATAGGALKLYKNNSLLYYGGHINGGAQFGNSTWQVKLNKGDYIDFRFSSSVTASSSAWCSILEQRI